MSSKSGMSSPKPKEGYLEDNYVNPEEGFPHEEWHKFPWSYCNGVKCMQEFKQAWMECGAYDPYNQVWSVEKMNKHLNDLYRAECGLAGCLQRLRSSGELLATV